jgi:hypothetical protein
MVGMSSSITARPLAVDDDDEITDSLLAGTSQDSVIRLLPHHDGGSFTSAVEAHL